MRRKLLGLTLALSLAIASLTGCGKSAETTAETTAVTEAASEAQTSEASSETTEASTDTTEASSETTEAVTADTAALISEDRSGNPITVPAEVNKIVSMAPSVTRTLIDLGLADKIVAIDTNSYDYVEFLPTGIAQFDMMNPDNESLVALEPDIIFTSGMSSKGGEDVFKASREAGVCVADIPSSTSFDQIAEDILFIGACTGTSDKADEIVKEFKVGTETLKSAAAEAANGETKTVLFMISLPTSDYPTLYSTGSNTYIDEMITDLGCKNVVGDQNSWVSISVEDAVALNPDVIFTNVNYVDNPVEEIAATPGWENVTAVKNNDIYYIDANTSNQPNQHVLEALFEMAKYLYPEYFKDVEFSDLENAA